MRCGVWGVTQFETITMYMTYVQPTPTHVWKTMSSAKPTLSNETTPYLCGEWGSGGIIQF